MRQELIEDREVARLDDDQLDHAGIAKQLAQLVISIPAPSNVALYGAWGSGKSGIGNMLSAELKNEVGVKFARFDAFKYAENPLRRNFVSVVANALGKSNSKYHGDLYSGRTNTDFKVPVRKLAHLLGIFALVVFVCATAASLAVIVVATAQQEDPFAAFLTIGVSTLPASLVPASLLTAVIALVGRTFVVERRVERADSDEEFEGLLQELVDDSGAKRVVIFVDELDRCAPDDVVATLNAVRTFLGVKKCVFVVAADQQVLEKALTQSASQATPIDTVNPYYSAGSGYLDKVFQYQVSVPPLLPQSITSFAVSLVDGRPGVWEEIDAQVVASILIPAHVRSPRRVKNLLNAFVLRYRLAIARQAGGQLDVDVRSNVDELARLVCLNVEFPLFARDLVTDPNLSEYVLALFENDGIDTKAVWARYPYVDAGTRRIAEGYAGLNRSVDRLLVTDDDGESENGTAIFAAKTTQGQQLIDYLSRTRLVVGPTRALIHLQNTGMIFGLSAAVADQLERDAQNASLSSLRDLFSSLDDQTKGAALDFLVQQARGSLGLEVSNIATAILALASDETSDVITRADAISVVIVEAVARNEQVLTDVTILGAWRLGLASSRAEGRSLLQLVLNSPLAVENEEIFELIMQSGATSVSIDSDRVSTIIIEKLFGDDPESVVSDILRAEAEEQLAIIECLSADLPSRLKDAFIQFDAATAVATAAPVAVNRRQLTSAPAPEDELLVDTFDPSGLLMPLGHLLQGLVANKEAAERVVLILLMAGRTETRSVIAPTLAALAPLSRDDTSTRLLSSTRFKALREWPEWLSPISPSVIRLASLNTYVPVVNRFWREALGPTSPDTTVLAEAAAALARLLDQAADTVVSAVQAAALPDVPGVGSAGDIGAFRKVAAVAQVMAETGLLNPTDLALRWSDHLVATLVQDVPTEPVESELATFVLDELRDVLTYRDATTGEPMAADVQDMVLAAFANSAWMSAPDATVRDTIATALRREDTATLGIDLPSSNRVSELKTELSAQGYETLLSYWLRATAESIEHVLSTVRTHLLVTPSPRFLKAVTEWQVKLSPEERYELVVALTAKASASLPKKAVLDAIGIDAIPDGDFASLIVDRFRSSNSNPERHRALELWKSSSISDMRSHRKLVREVLVPFIGLNAQATAIGLSFAPQLAPPLQGSDRKLLGEAIVRATEGNRDLKARGVRVMSGLGFKVEKTGLFGRTDKVDTST